MTKYCCCCCCFYRKTPTPPPVGVVVPLFFFSLAKKYALSCPSRSTGTWAWNSSASCANAKARNQTRRMSRSRAKTTTWLGGSAFESSPGLFPYVLSTNAKGSFSNVRQRPTEKGDDVNDDDEIPPMVDRRMLNSTSSSFCARWRKTGVRDTGSRSECRRRSRGLPL